jgi:hypothetical protein
LLKEVYTGVNFLFAFHICGTKNQINMKQKFLLVLICIFSLVASTQAQINKGSVWLGGNIGYSETKTKFESFTGADVKSISFKPAAGKAIKENLIAGVTFTYTKTTTINDGPANYYRKQTEKNIGGGVFLRKYVPVVSRLYIFGEAAAAYKNLKSTLSDPNAPNNKTNTKGWDAAISLTPGVSYAINNKLQLETGFNSLFSTVYGKSKTTSANPDLRGTSKVFATGINLENESTFYIGFRFLINSKG